MILSMIFYILGIGVGIIVWAFTFETIKTKAQLFQAIDKVIEESKSVDGSQRIASTLICFLIILAFIKSFATLGSFVGGVIIAILYLSVLQIIVHFSEA